jgi:hypothetical protein
MTEIFLLNIQIIVFFGKLGVKEMTEVEKEEMGFNARENLTWAL